jgi:hypothetical protein
VPTEPTKFFGLSAGAAFLAFALLVATIIFQHVVALD